MTEVEKLKKEVAELREQLNIQSQTLEVERQNLIRLFDNSAGFVAFMQGPRHVYTYVNPAHKKIVRADFTGKSILDAAPQAHNLHGVLKKVYETGEPFIHHMQPVTIMGDPHFMNANYVATRNEKGEIDGIMAWGIDITEQVAANNALMAERSLRERFVMALTHDLRTPLTSMKLTAQMLERKVNNPDYVSMSAQRILKSINHSERMILNLLDANRIQIGESLPHKPIECSLDQIVEGVIADEALVHGARFEYKNHVGPIHGYWDSTGIQRVVENLLENAVKYGFTDTTIKITLTKNEGIVDLQVHNDGFPIAPKDQAKIFIPYERTDSAQVSDQRGWGLGLALVKAIVESHKGSIRLESDQDKGTIFTVSLPIYEKGYL